MNEKQNSKRHQVKLDRYTNHDISSITHFTFNHVEFRPVVGARRLKLIFTTFGLT